MSEFNEILSQLYSRFGFAKDEIEKYIIIEPNRKHLSFYHESLSKVSCKSESLGISFAKHKQKWPKLTTGATRVLGHLAKKNIVNLNRELANSYMQRNSFDIDSSSLEACESAGYVIVKYLGNPIGVAMLKFGDKSPYLCSLYPKNWKKN